ncbi:MAG TPA: glycosyltransferase N-terminal domain-containing protein, partial [Chthoniobacterales bacterium]|nr:glycosyltransferase N-terminal domain-containing protein [Chthoniobacterales bacterium]
MIRFLYNLLFPFALLVFLPGYVLKMRRRGNYRDKFGQRLGIYDRETRRRLSAGHQTWVHAVSVGEVMIALKLVARMKQSEPDLRIALTTTTTTGFALANRQAQPWVEVLYTPLDFWPIMRRAFALIRPERIVLVEAEVWPNLTAIAHRKN